MCVEANVLYFGDNLDILRRHVKDESVDLGCLDPPFSLNGIYNAGRRLSLYEAGVRSRLERSRRRALRVEQLSCHPLYDVRSSAVFPGPILHQKASDHVLG